MRVISSGKGVCQEKEQTVCHTCGCFFEYDNKFDFRMSGSTYTETLWALKCPECNCVVKTKRQPIVKSDFNKVKMEGWDDHQPEIYGVH